MIAVIFNELDSLDDKVLKLMSDDNDDKTNSLTDNTDDEMTENRITALLDEKEDLLADCVFIMEDRSQK